MWYTYKKKKKKKKNLAQGLSKCVLMLAHHWINQILKKDAFEKIQTLPMW